MNTTSVESYLEDGCGRCDKYQTPDCKVHQWTDALVTLRGILQQTELDETMKWGSPCYALDGKNVLMLTSFKDYCALSFFQGVGLDDPDERLTSPGPNSRYMRLLTFQSKAEVDAQREVIDGFLSNAIALAASGKPLDVPPANEPMPDELEERLAGDPALQKAYDELTPGRQRSHILYVGGAKQSATRVNRAERCVPKIMAGKGYNER